MPPKKKDEENPVKKKKPPPKELCGCGVDTYRPPPKGKRGSAPIEHAAGCVYQRVPCSAYPHLRKCVVCLNPCKYCAGTNRWCPHCYEKRCTNIYRRVVHGHEKVEEQRKTKVMFSTADTNNITAALSLTGNKGPFSASR